MESVTAEGICQRNKGNTEKSHFMIYSFLLCYHDHVGHRRHRKWALQTQFSATGLLFQSSQDRSPTADLNVIYRTQDSFNIKEGKEIVIYMRCFNFHLVPKQLLLSSLSFQENGKMGQNVQASSVRGSQVFKQREAIFSFLYGCSGLFPSPSSFSIS